MIDALRQRAPVQLRAWLDLHADELAHMISSVTPKAHMEVITLNTSTAYAHLPRLYQMGATQESSSGSRQKWRVPAEHAPEVREWAAKAAAAEAEEDARRRAEVARRNAEQMADPHRMVPLRGDTYNHRAEIRAKGGQWNAGEKVWYVPQQHLTQLSALIGGRPAAPLAAAPAQDRDANRKPAACDRCGAWLPAGKGRLVYCAEDSGCAKHMDQSGYHVYCSDEAACNARLQERAAERAAEQAKKADRRAAYDAARESALADLVEVPQAPASPHRLDLVSIATDDDRTLYRGAYAGQSLVHEVTGRGDDAWRRWFVPRAQVG